MQKLNRRQQGEYRLSGQASSAMRRSESREMSIDRASEYPDRQYKLRRHQQQEGTGTDNEA